MVLALAACHRGPPSPALGDLHGAAAQAGSASVPIALVYQTANATRVPPRPPNPRTALQGLIEDALAGDEAYALGLDEVGTVTWQSSALLARRVAAHLHDEAERQGPARDDELGDVSVVHAVVLRSSALGAAGASALADSIAIAVAPARDEQDFIARATAVPHGVARVVAQTVAPFDASGTTSEGTRIDPSFVAAAFALHTPGETTEVETPFGLHVVRLIAKTVPAPEVLAARRSDLAANVVDSTHARCPRRATSCAKASNDGRGHARLRRSHVGSTLEAPVMAGAIRSVRSTQTASHAKGRLYPERRDQAASEFGHILEAFLARAPGALAAALVDSEGETVDYAGRVDPFLLRVAAAHFRIVFGVAQSQPALEGTSSILVRALRRSFLIHSVAEGYALCVLFARGAGFTGWQRALAVCAHRLSSEAGWKVPRPTWFPVEIRSDERLRPLSVKMGHGERSVEVLGALASSALGRERAWRVRVATGEETMLVREAGGAWYADEPLSQTGSGASPAVETR